MMTDIVDRLREGIFGGAVAKTDGVLNAYMQEGADEIARLRAAIADAYRKGQEDMRERAAAETGPYSHEHVRHLTIKDYSNE